MCLQKIPEPSLSLEWKLFDTGSDGTTAYVNTKRITYLPEGIIKVWDLLVSKGETREKIVNASKKYLLLKGEDLNKAERYWYHIGLIKINCKTHQIAFLESDDYSFEGIALNPIHYQPEEWDNIFPVSMREAIEKYVYKKHKSKK